VHKTKNHFRKTKDLLEFTMRWQHIGKGTVYTKKEGKVLRVKVKAKVKVKVKKEKCSLSTS